MTSICGIEFFAGINESPRKSLQRETGISDADKIGYLHEALLPSSSYPHHLFLHHYSTRRRLFEFRCLVESRVILQSWLGALGGTEYRDLLTFYFRVAFASDIIGGFVGLDSMLPVFFL